jgi:phosphinothricin acetyltransferase
LVAVIAILSPTAEAMMPQPCLIRDAELGDLPGILSIYNEVIANSTAVYWDVPMTLEDRRAWFDARRAQGFPVLAAVEGTTVVGFSSFGEWRHAPCYRHAVEHTVHVSADRRGNGIGRDLVEALFPLAKAKSMHVMIGGVDAANEASLRFHERLGFDRVATFREVGRKFGRWLDLVFLQRLL